MRKENLNVEHIEGYLYQHDLEKKVTGENSKNPGTEYIRGNIYIATDEEGLNIVPINFTYVTAVTAKGKKNPTYNVLCKIIDEDKTWLSVGKDEALKLSNNASFEVNDFCSPSTGDLVTAKRNSAGFFLNVVAKLNDDINKRNKWEADVLITNIATIDANDDLGTEEVMAVRGYVFNWQNALQPVEYIVKSEAGKKYLDSFDITPSKPVFIKLWGNIVNSTIKTTHVEEAGFGEPRVIESTKTIREWIITGGVKEPYELGDGVLTGEEYEELLQKRKIYLADVQSEYEKRKAGQNEASTPAAPVKNGNFKF